MANPDRPGGSNAQPDAGNMGGYEDQSGGTQGDLKERTMNNPGSHRQDPLPGGNNPHRETEEDEELTEREDQGNKARPDGGAGS